MSNAYLGLGSNMGKSEWILSEAVRRLSQTSGEITNESPLYKTKAWGNENQHDFINQVVVLQTNLVPADLMQHLLNIELEMGRKRIIKNAPRSIDIDILFYDDAIINLPHLTIPHPLLSQRRFVLIPLNDINPELVHPVLHKTIRQLLAECTDRLDVKKI